MEERTSLSRNTVVDLFKLCLGSTYFLYQGEYNQQMEGAAVGSPVSPITTNIYMEEFEQLALNTAPTLPRQWKWYVDDTFCIIEEQTAEGFLKHLTSLKPKLETRPSTVPRFRTTETDKWKAGNFCVQKAHAHRQVPTIPFTPPNTGEEGTGKVSV